MIEAIMEDHLDYYTSMLMAYKLMTSTEDGSFFNELCRATMLEF